MLINVDIFLIIHIVSSGFMYIIWKELTKHPTNEHYLQYIIYI